MFMIHDDGNSVLDRNLLRFKPGNMYSCKKCVFAEAFFFDILYAFVVYNLPEMIIYFTSILMIFEDASRHCNLQLILA